MFERLEENKRKKQEEYDKEHDIKNVVRGIDDDEAAFLDKVDEIKSEAEYQRIKEERRELEEYKKLKEKMLEEQEEKRIRNDLVVKTQTSKTDATDPTKKKQAKLLSGIIRKREANEKPKSPESKSKTPKTSLALAGLGDYGSSSNEDSDS